MLFPWAQNVSLEQRCQCAHVHGEQVGCVDLGVHVEFVQVDQGRLVGTVLSFSNPTDIQTSRETSLGLVTSSLAQVV